MGRARQLASNENQDRILLNASAASTDEGEHLLLDASATNTDVGFFFNTEIGTTETPPEGFVIESSLAANAVTNSKITDDAVTVSKMDSTSQSLSNRNLVKNGSMRVAQRGTSAITLSNAAVSYTLDRMHFYKANAGTQTVEQSTDAPPGFDNSLLVKNTSEDSSVTAADRVSLIYRFEGLDAAKLDFGTVNAKTVTISWYVKSTVSGKFGGALGNGSDNRSNAFLYDIFSPNQWERKSVTIAGDTAGTWVTTNARDLQISLSMTCGSNHSGTANGAWEAADRVSATGADTTWLETADAEWSITGLQLEIGSEATEFEHTDIAHDIQQCQRYFVKFLEGNNQEIGVGWYYSSSHASFMFQYPTTMRATPTAIDSTGSGYYTIYAAGGSDAFNSITFENGNATNYSALNSSEVSGTAGQAGMVRATNASAKVEFLSEI